MTIYETKIESKGGMTMKKIKSRKWNISIAILTAVVIAISGGYFAFRNQINGLFGGEENGGYIPNPKETISPGSMPSQEISPTPNPTLRIILPTPNPISSTKISLTPEVIQTLDEKMTDFLDREGNFTEEESKDSIFLVGSNYGVETTALGSMYEQKPCVQGYLFDFLKKDESLVLIIGFDGDKNERFITGLEVPLYYYRNYPEANLNFLKFGGKSVSGSNISLFAKSGEVDVIEKYLDQLKDRYILFDLDFFGPDFDINNSDGILKEMLAERVRKQPITKKLVMNVAKNNIPIDGFGSFDGLDVFDLVNINDSGDIDNINVSDIPIVAGISFFGSLDK